MTCSQRAVDLKPDYANGWANLGSLYWRSSLVEESIACHRKAVALNSTAADVGSCPIFTMQYDPRTTSADLAAELAQWNQRYAASLTASAAPHRNTRDPDRRLRIGYLSSDLRQHVVGRNVLPLLTHHDRKQFEIYAYYSHAVGDEMTTRFKACCDGWRDGQRVSDEQLAEMIRADGIDVLVDLHLHTLGNRLPVVARRPAPVQITFAGYPGSTGMPAVDCRISDPFLDPPGQFDGLFVERVERLPHCFWCIWGVEQPTIGPLPALTEGTLTFGSLNDPAKAGTTSVALWAQVLNAVPRSRMLILSWSQRHRRRMLEQFAAAGVASDRFSLIERLPRLQYLDGSTR